MPLAIESEDVSMSPHVEARTSYPDVCRANGGVGNSLNLAGDPAWACSLAGGVEMGARIRSFDWSSTPLGPIDEWPLSLLDAVSLCLRSRFQLAIYCEPQLVAGQIATKEG